MEADAATRVVAAMAPAKVAKVTQYNKCFCRKVEEALFTSGKTGELVVWSETLARTLARHSTFAMAIFVMPFPFAQWTHAEEMFCRQSLDASDQSHSYPVDILADDKALGAPSRRAWSTSPRTTARRSLRRSPS